MNHSFVAVWKYLIIYVQQQHYTSRMDLSILFIINKWEYDDVVSQSIHKLNKRCDLNTELSSA